MMQGSHLEKQDPSVNSAMEDANAMTIEFLRARLLAERAVSKSARDRADELAQRVAELEEQLKVVSLQRKKAEKATVDVLAILEENGFTNISETFDSSSEPESFSETTKVEESSVNSRARNNQDEEEELLASEHDSFSVSGRSLSWKGRKNELNSSEKFKESLARRRRVAESVYISSQKPRQGKSCRQIRRRESRIVAEGRKTDRDLVDFRENRGETSFEVFPRATEERPNTAVEGLELLGETDVQIVSDSNCLEDEIDTDINMERALERQAQLIGRFEDMEKAQREWEQKFRGNNIPTPDSCDPGNHSDVTEESEETKGQTQHHGVSVVSLVQEARSATEAIPCPEESSNSQSNGLHGDSITAEDNELYVGVSESVGPVFALPVATGKHNQENFEKEQPSPQTSNHYLDQNSSCENNQSRHIMSSNSESSHCKNEPSDIRKEVYAPVQYGASSGCDGVLKALKQARLSLEDKIRWSPSPKSTEPSLPQVIASLDTRSPETVCIRKYTGPSSICSTEVEAVSHMVEIPVGCVGLFRVPTNLSAEASKVNFLGSGSCLSLRNPCPKTTVTTQSSHRPVTEASRTNFLSSGFQRSLSRNNFPDTGTPLAAGNRPLTTPYVGGSLLRSSFPTDDSLVASAQLFRPFTATPPAYTGNAPPFSHYSENRSRIYTEDLSFDPLSDSSLPSYLQQTYPAILSHPNPIHQSKKRFSASYQGHSAELPPTNHLLFYHDNFRLNTYK